MACKVHTAAPGYCHRGSTPPQILKLRCSCYAAGGYDLRPYGIQSVVTAVTPVSLHSAALGAALPPHGQREVKRGAHVGALLGSPRKSAENRNESEEKRKSASIPPHWGRGQGHPSEGTKSQESPGSDRKPGKVCIVQPGNSIHALKSQRQEAKRAHSSLHRQRSKASGIIETEADWA